MNGPGVPTLDQLQVLLAVEQAGSFAAAARTLNRATSAITYAIDNLEAQLGLKLFDRVATRRPILTEAGRAVLAEASRIARGVDLLRAKVKGLQAGLEAQVSLVVDVLLPTARLVDALQAFQAEFPTVALRLHVEALGAVTQLVLERTATIGISGPLNATLSGTERIGVGGARMVPVAAPSHPLAVRGEHKPGAAREHIQLVLTDRSALTAGRDFGVIAVNTWRLGDLGSKHALLLAGAGWGGMPEPTVRADLAAGRLVRLALPDWPAVTYKLDAIHRTDTPPGPAAKWLIERFVAQARGDDSTERRQPSF
jgi:DNA-binding transcriptional LysR family regulator